LRVFRVKSGAGIVSSGCARARGKKNNAHAKQKKNVNFFAKTIVRGEKISGINISEMNQPL
jgi:hypothetical protein